MVYVNIYTIVVAPIWLCFHQNLVSHLLSLRVLDAVMEFVTLVHVYLCFGLPFVDKDTHRLVTEKTWIRARYVRGWLAADVLSGIPVHLVQFMVATIVAILGLKTFSVAYSRVVGLCEGFVTLKLIRISHVAFRGASGSSKGVIIAGIGMREDFAVANNGLFDVLGPINSRALKLVLIFLLAVHYVACLYYLAAHTESSSRDPGIVEAAGELEAADDTWLYYSQTGTSLWQSWAKAYHFSLCSILGNFMVPQSALQCNISSLIVILGMLLNSFIIGLFSSIVSTANEPVALQKAKMDKIDRYLLTNDVPQELQRMIRSFYQYLWAESTEDGLFDDLSESLKYRLQVSVKRRFINSCPFFRGISFSCVVTIIRRLKRRIMIPTEVVCTEGELGDEMCVTCHTNGLARNKCFKK